MIKHYKGVLGEFDYDDKEFEVFYNFHDEEYLKYIGEGKSVDLPNGCINTRYMFSNCELPEGFTLGYNFDTYKVKNMYCMFENCILPEGFTLGNKFYTYNVINMDTMFYKCKFLEKYFLEDHFNTSNVKDMEAMFFGCTFPEEFTLGNKFDTGNVENMDMMFYNCKFHKQFNFGSKFKIDKVKMNKHIDSIFGCCKLMPYNMSIDHYLYNTLIKGEIVI